MKAISLWQPWASFIASGHKRYETRSWSTGYRGNLAIHAAKKWDRELERYLHQMVCQFPELEDYAGIKTPPLGQIVRRAGWWPSIGPRRFGTN